jgi:nucleotide-binding universal stress UspA family protein
LFVHSYKRVLVALDGSPSSEAVLRFLLEIAGPLEGRRHEAEEYLAPIAAGLRARGVDVTFQVRQGRPDEEILVAAREHGADPIAMATHGRTGLGRLLFGSVAEAVLRHATVPVFLIRQPQPMPAECV